MNPNTQLPVVLEKSSVFPTAFIGGVHIRKPSMAFAVRNTPLNVQKWTYSSETRTTSPEGSFWCVGCGYWKDIGLETPSYVCSFRMTNGEETAKLHCDECATYMVNTFSNSIKCCKFATQLLPGEEAYVAKARRREQNVKKAVQAWKLKVVKAKERKLLTEVLPPEFIQWADLCQRLPLGVRFE